MIEAVGLTKSYAIGRSETIEALRGVSFCVQPGEIVGYLGPNGAGKSTTVRILTGLQPATSGDARIGGHDIRQDPLAAKRLVGLVPETGAVYEALSPLEYLRFVGQLYELAPDEITRRAGELLEFLELEPDAWSRRMSGFSKGMKQRVVIVAALLHRPKVILLDEPLNGLDVNATVKMKQLLAREAAGGAAILYCSHLLDVVERVCTRIILLSRGAVRIDGSLNAVLGQHPGMTLEQVFQHLTAGSDPLGQGNGKSDEPRMSGSAREVR